MLLSRQKDRMALTATLGSLSSSTISVPSTSLGSETQGLSIQEMDTRISPLLFRLTSSNKTYLAWKEDGLFIYNSYIMIQEVELDGITLKNGSVPTPVLKSQDKQDKMVVEAPWLIYKDPYYYLFFSTNLFFSADYKVGVARSRRVLGPYRRLKRPVISANVEQLRNGTAEFTGPGTIKAILQKSVLYPLGLGLQIFT